MGATRILSQIKQIVQTSTVEGVLTKVYRAIEPLNTRVCILRVQLSAYKMLLFQQRGHLCLCARCVASSSRIPLAVRPRCAVLLPIPPLVCHVLGL